MQSPFPGMDPYLEAPSLWPDVHARLAFAICDQLQPLLSPRYTAAITPYVAYETIDIAPARFVVPDVAVFKQGLREATEAATTAITAPLVGLLPEEVPTRYYTVEIRAVGDQALVTMIEILSPVNKRPGFEGAEAYDRKRRELLRSAVHLLEIDLLRGGQRPALKTPLPAAPYFVLLSRAERRPQVEIWPLLLQQPVPAVPVPLLPADGDVTLNLAEVLQRIYASARYDLRIDYRQEPPPPALAEADQLWLHARLQAAGKR